MFEEYRIRIAYWQAEADTATELARRIVCRNRVADLREKLARHQANWESIQRGSR
jgi:phage shock protein A